MWIIIILGRYYVSSGTMILYLIILKWIYVNDYVLEKLKQCCKYHTG